MLRRLHPLFNEDGEIGASSNPTEGVVTEENVAEPQSEADENQDSDKIEKSKSFAKRLEERTNARLSEERAKWEAEQSEKYKDHDAYRKAAEFLQKTSGISDIMTLKEEIELSELQERAEETGITPEMQKRLEVLEAKASKADELEARQQQEQQWKEFEGTLKTFCEGKEIDGTPVDHMELWKYMHENEVSKPEVALKAMKADVLEQKLSTAREDSVKDYLASKQAPRAEGNNGAAGTQRVDTRNMSWKELERHAAARIEAARQPQ